MDLPVAFYDAVLGGKVEAPTPDGPVNVSVPKGANTGTRLRLKGRGLSDAKGHRGDLFARLEVTLPEGADAALEAFAEEQKAKRPYSPKRRA
jgi:DnaJ-class molecular chaperone